MESVHKRVRYLFLSFPFFSLFSFFLFSLDLFHTHIHTYIYEVSASARFLSAFVRVYRPDLARPPDCRNQAIEPRPPCLEPPLAATRNKRNKRGRGVCVTLLYMYVHTGACKQRRRPGYKERRREKSREREKVKGEECRKSRIRRG